MNCNSINGDVIDLTLRLMGATQIREFPSFMHIVDFNLGDGVVVTYVFNITREDKYFLQRVKPYAISHGKFANVQEIIAFIKDDIEKFRNAKKSHNFPEFLEIFEKEHQFLEDMEDLFLTHNIDKAMLEEIKDDMQLVMKKVQKVEAPELPELQQTHPHVDIEK